MPEKDFRKETSKPFRVAVFASYDKNGRVWDYVISYIKRLREVCDKIIFIADNEATQEEQNKLTGLVDFKQFQRHGEYDFGSYKRGWQYLKNQEWFSQIDELILCNDSCFSVGALTPVFEQMSHKQCDFWGMTENQDHQSHLQSFFLVFKKKHYAISTI
jgi:lipopolysaccharide biosynthesis protein